VVDPYSVLSVNTIAINSSNQLQRGRGTCPFLLPLHLAQRLRHRRRLLLLPRALTVARPGPGVDFANHVFRPKKISHNLFSGIMDSSENKRKKYRTILDKVLGF
jgi:hypothetical protein